MKILLLGEYSNVHNTLAEGLKAIGHECVVASGGDHWKNYPRDIDLQRSFGLWGNVSFMWRLYRALPKMRDFDIVQLINPVFLELRAERIIPIYDYLRRNNRKVVLGAFGMDYHWVKVNTDVRPLRYSDFNFGDTIRHDEQAELFRKEYLGTAKGDLCQFVANDCDYIVAGLQEYFATYDAVPELRNKLTFLPFPIKIEDGNASQTKGIDDYLFSKNASQTNTFERPSDAPLRIFVGISKERSAYKGTDIMLAAAQAVKEKYPDRVELQIAEGVPFNVYKQMMDSADCILDQLFSYTPAMNSLLAMSKGIINIGGGEPENYDILPEPELRPIINVEPNFESCYHEIEQLVLHPERIPELKRQSVEYVRRHHDYIKVALKYESLYKQILNS